MSKDKMQMTITLEVVGKEGLKCVVEYKDTTLETVKAVENAIMTALATINQ